MYILNRTHLPLRFVHPLCHLAQTHGIKLLAPLKLQFMLISYRATYVHTNIHMYVFAMHIIATTLVSYPIAHTTYPITHHPSPIASSPSPSYSISKPFVSTVSYQWEKASTVSHSHSHAFTYTHKHMFSCVYIAKRS